MATSTKTRARIIGKVRSAAMRKSIVVEVAYKAKHARFGKFINKKSRYYAHDENNDARAGDTVEIEETRPLSKTKRWRLIRVVERAVE